jgi:peptidyl-prolyl cis-trans isomerase C
VPRRFASALLFTCGAAITTLSLAQGGGASPAVARVGDRRLTADELAHRMEAAPRIRFRYLGGDARTARRRFLDEELGRIALARLAEARGVSERADVRRRVDALLATRAAVALLAASPPAPVTEDDIQAAYDADPDRFRTPPSYVLWHIVVGTEAEARDILSRLDTARRPKDGGVDPKTWRALAASKSLDEATRERSGNLGVVSEDGTSSLPGVTVSSAELAAARAVDDLALVPAPVRVEAGYAVVWRRKHVPASVRRIDEVRQSLRNELSARRRDAVLEAFVERHRSLGTVRVTGAALLDAL